MRGIADYEFSELIGEGNHGTYYRAVTPSRLALDADTVVVKVLHEQAADAEFRRMANELRVHAAVPSPHLLTIHEAGHQDGRLYHVSDDSPLGSLAGAAVPLDPPVVLAAVADAARAAHALHEAGIAHRDIKPFNVKLVEGGGRLADLGLAQLLHPGLTVTGVGPVGALEYLAPEIAVGADAGRATDVWALGATMHRALTGRSLYPGLPETSILEAIRHVLDTAPIVGDDLDAASAEVLGLCLARDPAERPATALELADAIDRVAGR